MMSIAAIVPVASVAAANAALDAQGFGPGCFSIPVLAGGVRPAFGSLHSWDVPGFLAALEAIPAVTVTTGAGDARALVTALVQAEGAQWPYTIPPLPDEGMVQTGELYTAGSEAGIWLVIQPIDRGTFPGPPEDYPAQFRPAILPGVALPWRQPLGAADAYYLENAFTGEPDQATHLGKLWRVSQASAAGGFNTFEPGVFGWVEVT